VTIRNLTPGTIKLAVKGSVQFIQDEKISVSQDTIRKAQGLEQWPDEYLSFVGTVKKANSFKDPAKFFRVMHFKPNLWNKNFTFLPAVDDNQQLADATRLADSVIKSQTRAYLSPVRTESTGHYASRFKYLLNGTDIKSYSQFDDAPAGSIVNIYNTALYAGALEKNALYYSKVGGILYYAAKRVRKAYPNLGVRFVYWRAANTPGANHKYDVPVLTIGNRANVTDEIKRPGRRHRSTGRRIRRRQRGNQI
jgi:hypothetical protein